MDASDVEYTAGIPSGDHEEGASAPQQQKNLSPSQPSNSEAVSRNDSGSLSSNTGTSLEDTKPRHFARTGRLTLSIAKLIAAGRGSDAAPADHFTALPSNAQEAALKSSQNPPLAVFSSTSGDAVPKAKEPWHGLPEARWGTQGLLGSKPQAARSGLASAKSMLSAHLGISNGGGGMGDACAAESVGGGEESCEYVAMATPCESPVAIEERSEPTENQRHGAQRGGSQFFAPNREGDSARVRSPSSRSGLVTRLGSALQSWTTGRTTGESSRTWGDGAAREGRPGPLGAKYTQHAPPVHSSPFEPSPHHQLKKSLPVDPAFTAAAAGVVQRGRGAVERAVPGESESRMGLGGSLTKEDKEGSEDSVCGGTTHARREVMDTQRGKEEQEKNTEQQQTTSTVERGAEMCSTIGEVRDETAPNPPVTQAKAVEGREAGAEAGAGSEISSIKLACTAEIKKTRGVSTGKDLALREGGEHREKKNGLWELKAEWSRLDQALTEAEIDRNIEKAIGVVSSARLKEAMAQLEALRRRVGGDHAAVEFVQ